MKIAIWCTYHCGNNHWVKVWHSKPWFGDYADKCSKCGRMVWYTTMKDYSQ